MSEQLIKTPGIFGENGNFLLERELGAGGMGGVYMGRDKMLDRPVAIKVMLKEYGSDAEFVDKFKQEAQSAARLIHPNIAQIYSYGICDGMPYIAMELAPSGSLYTIMQANRGKTDVARVLKICQQVAQALQCASDQGCVHGDVKPENILLDANGNAKLVDFGLAAMQKETDEIWGTPYYISPEKVKKEPIDFRADMYSLGGTLYHALTGVAPFEGEDSIAVVKKRFEGMPKKPSEIRPDLTPEIDNLVMTMLAVNKEDRFPSMEALLETFRTVLTTGLSTTAMKPAARTTTKPATGGAKKMTVARGRRMVMRRPGAAASSLRKTDAEEDKGVKVSTIPEDEEEEEGGNLGLKVAGIIIGTILLVGGVLGGLVWYQIADKKARAADEQAQIVGGIEKARGAIRDTVVSAEKFADEFDQFAYRAIETCQKPTDALKKILPAEQGEMLKPGPSKELLDAIAATNDVPAVTNAVVATNATVAVAATTNATATATATTNAPPPSAEAKQEREKAEPPPQVVIAMNELWERAYGCQASAVRIRHAIRQVLKKASEADEIKDQTRDAMEKLAELSRTLVEQFEQIKVSKDVENVRKGITFIKSKGEKTVEQTVKRLRIEKLEAERKAKAEAAAAAEKERLEKLEAEKKAKIEEERAAIKNKFENIVSQGCLRQLDWKSALRQLETTKSEFTTPEGQLAADIEIRKVNDMKKVQELFIKGLKGYVFRGKLKGAKVESVNEKEISLVRADGKKKMKISWQKFYKDYPGNLNELINLFIVHTRQPNSKHRLSLREWADAMTGAALTMKLVCSEVNGAIERAETLVKETVKEFPDYQKTAHEFFPEITFEESTTEE